MSPSTFWISLIPFASCGLFSFSEGDPADDYSGEWTDDSTFVVVIIDPADSIPTVKGLVPFSNLCGQGLPKS